jgi:desulfoferrodoxin-like iron-binding protein
VNKEGGIKMTELRQRYKCDICGNIVEVVHNSGGTLVCCGKPMTLKVESTQDAEVQKHNNSNDVRNLQKNIFDNCVNAIDKATGTKR